jgi:hypothetical protein
MCDHWREDFGTQQVDLFFKEGTNVPVRVQVETVEKEKPVRLTSPDVT